MAALTSERRKEFDRWYEMIKITREALQANGHRCQVMLESEKKTGALSIRIGEIKHG